MIAPQLTDAELAAVRAARSMRVVEYDGGSRVAMCGNTVLFRAGGEVSFALLWAQAEQARAEVAAGYMASAELDRRICAEVAK